MTTIVYDGKQMVAESQLTHFEEQNKFRKTKPGRLALIVALLKARYDRNAQCQKIFTPKNFFYMGQPVRAIGVAGQVHFIELVRKHLEERVELSEESFYPAGFFDLLIVLDDGVANVGRPPGKNEMRFQKLPLTTTHEGLTSYSVYAIGSGMESIRHVLGCGARAYELVSMACIFDIFSGGTLTVWDPQSNGGQVVMGVPRLGRLKAVQTVVKTSKAAHKALAQLRAGQVPDEMPHCLVQSS